MSPSLAADYILQPAGSHAQKPQKEGVKVE